MVPWPRGTGGPRTQREVLENALSYIRFLQRTLSSVRGGAAPPADPADPSGGDPAVTQRLVPYEDEDPPKATNPWLGPTGPYWDELGRAGGVPVSPPPGRLGPLGLSPSLVASPPPPGPPDDVIRGPRGGSARARGGQLGDPVGDIAGTAQGPEGPGGAGDPGDPGDTGPPPPCQEEMRERLHHVLPHQPQTLHQRTPGRGVHGGHAGAGAALAQPPARPAPPLLRPRPALQPPARPGAAPGQR
ncbi:meiosis initiator protein isoform X2 [Patagioenas fasciata]|uniref:meiosis initiator protein isoform X2 n=1 Tax=Patagioenas fasciata TaxID=372321 RepID=UPI003A9A09CF